MQNTIENKVDTREIITPSKGTSFDYLYYLAHEIQTKCMDFNVSEVNHSKMMLNAESGHLVYRPDSYDNTQVRNVGLTRYAMSQLCNKLGVPIRYVEKCIESGMIDLAADNVNAWLEDYNRNLFIREYDGKIRGVLSDRYMALDTPDILDVLSEVVDSSQYTTKGYFLSPERFHARIVQNEMMNIDGEDLFAGIQIDSSDVGRSTLQVRFMIFKQVCTNGLCISRAGGVLFEQRHIGISVDDFRSGFKQSMVRIPQLIEQAEDLVEASREKSGKYAVNLFSSSELDEFIERIRIKTRLSEESAGKVISLMKEKYSPTRWGLINSITEVAQDFTLERRVELEKMAGDLLLVA